MEIYKKTNTDAKEVRWQDDVNASIAQLESLAVDLAEIEVSAGNLEIEDIPENLQDAVRVKIDDSKWKDK